MYARAELSDLVDPSPVMSGLVAKRGAGSLALDATAAGWSLLVLISLKLGLLIVAAPFSFARQLITAIRAAAQSAQ
jgi:hypothetical protein